MSTNPELHKHIQRGPPNMFNLPDMFREIAHSLRQAFRRARARHRQRTCSILDVFIDSMESCWAADNSTSRQTFPPSSGSGARRARVVLEFLTRGPSSVVVGVSRFSYEPSWELTSHMLTSRSPPSTPTAAIPSHRSHIRLSVMTFRVMTHPSYPYDHVAIFSRSMYPLSTSISRPFWNTRCQSL